MQRVLVQFCILQATRTAKIEFCSLLSSNGNFFSRIAEFLILVLVMQWQESSMKNVSVLQEVDSELDELAKTKRELFYAPFFTTWFCSMGTIFFLPIYLICLLLSGAKSSKIRNTFKEGIQGFRSKGFNLGNHQDNKNKLH